MKNKFRNILLSVLIFVFILEILFRMFGVFSTYNEKNGSIAYTSSFYKARLTKKTRTITRKLNIIPNSK